MNVETLAVLAVLSHTADVTDVHIAQDVVWVTTTGGLVGYSQAGELVSSTGVLPNRQAMAVGMHQGALTVGTAVGAYTRDGQDWLPFGPATPVIAVTESMVVYRDGSTWPQGGLVTRLVDAVEWNGEVVGFTADGLMVAEEETFVLPGPVADVAVVDGKVRIACHIAAAIYDGAELQVLPIPATAAGPVWGTAEGVLVDDLGSRVAAVQGTIDEVRASETGWLVGTDNGLWSVGEEIERWTTDGPCGNFITGLTRHEGELIVGTFNGGACAYDGQRWRTLKTPSRMVNDVASTGEELWIATAEGLVQVGQGVHVAVVDDAPLGTPGTNHAGINALSAGPEGLWAADVLGPVSVAPWRQYRWHVSGHSYQAIASCPGGEVWAGSEDDGLAVRGVDVGRKMGRSTWRQFNRLDGMPEDWVMSIACAGPGAAWVGTYRSGVGRVDASGWHSVLEDAWVQALWADGDVLWIGTADGLYRLDEAGIVQLTQDDVHSLLRDGDDLWVGTRSGLLQLCVTSLRQSYLQQPTSKDMG